MLKANAAAHHNNIDHDPIETAPFLRRHDDETDIELQATNRNYEINSIAERLSSDSTFGNELIEQEYQHKTEPLKSIFSKVGSCFGTRTLGCTSKRSIVQRTKRPKRIRPLRFVWRILLVILFTLGLFQLGTLILGVLTAFFPDRLDHAFRTWRNQDSSLGPLSHWPTDSTADIVPVACHSHNDYWRKVPLESAIKAGCVSVEADVWLVNDDLQVGHKKSALTTTRTLKSLYIVPLLRLLDEQNKVSDFVPKLNDSRHGIFDTDSLQSLVLLIDFKTDYQALWPVVSAQLEPLRKNRYLTYFNGTSLIKRPITIVVTGNAPFYYVVKNLAYRDMFFDAPLEMLIYAPNSTQHILPPSAEYDSELELQYLASVVTSSGQPSTSSNDASLARGQGHSGPIPANPRIYSPYNSYYASVSFMKNIGRPGPYLSPVQHARIESQIHAAHVQGLKVRYWDTPAWPVGMRNYLWREMLKLGVDILNVDDLWAGTRGDWRSRGWWVNWWEGWSPWGGRDW